MVVSVVGIMGDSQCSSHVASGIVSVVGGSRVVSGGRW